MTTLQFVLVANVIVCNIIIIIDIVQMNPFIYSLEIVKNCACRSFLRNEMLQYHFIKKKMQKYHNSI